MNTRARRTWVWMDAGDTLIYGYPTLYEAMQDCWKSVGQNVEIPRIKACAMEYLKSHSYRDVVSQEKFEAYMKGLYRTCFTDLVFPGDVEVYVARLWEEWRSGRRLRLFDDVKAALERLKSCGYRLGILSNWDLTLPGLLERFGIDTFFERVVISCREGVAKPNPALFERALAQVGIEAGQAWYVGDHVEHDILPARSLGMGTIHVDYYGKGGSGGTADLDAPSMSVAAWGFLSESAPVVPRETVRDSGGT